MSGERLPAAWFRRYHELEAKGFNLAKRIEILNAEFPEPTKQPTPQRVLTEVEGPPPRRDTD